MIKSLLRLLFLLLLFPTNLYADTAVKFIGQFGDKAVIGVDGKRRILRVGETSREGVKLLSVESDQAVILFNGKKQTLVFSQRTGSTYKARDHTEVKVSVDAYGGFRTPGSINGHLVSFLIDTGASSVAMNETVARKLGIDFRYSGTPSTVTTASGVVSAYSIKLASVKVGEIELRNIRATVLEGGYPVEVLLGMSFLSRLELERKGNLITLRKTH